MIELGFEAAEAEGANAAGFSIKLYDPELVVQRRRIRSFMQGGGPRQIVLAGEP